MSNGKPTIPVIKKLIKNIAESEKKIRLSGRIGSFLENINDFADKQRAKEFFFSM